MIQYRKLLDTVVANGVAVNRSVTEIEKDCYTAIYKALWNELGDASASDEPHFIADRVGEELRRGAAWLKNVKRSMQVTRGNLHKKAQNKNKEK